jgi:hypothetical protein
MATDQCQLSPANVEARFQLREWRRPSNPRADDTLFRPIDADDYRANGESAGDCSNLRQNVLVRITFPLPPNMRLIDPATNSPSTETFVDVWRALASVNDVALTGRDGLNPWARLPNPSGGYQLDARVGTLQEQALRVFTNHAQVQHAPSARCSTIVVPASAVHQPSRAGPCRARERRHVSTAGSRSAAFRVRAARQSGVRARLRPMSW